MAQNALNGDQGGSIELGGTNSIPNPVPGGKPYIDFHYGNGLVQDLNFRIINYDDKRLDFASANHGTFVTFVNGNVGIGTTTPAQRLHVVGKAIIDDGTVGTPVASTWGAGGSRIILGPGSATATPYQLGIAPSTLWAGVPAGGYFTIFRDVHRQFIVSPTTAPAPGAPGAVSVGGNINYPSIFIGTVTSGFSPGPYPKQGTLLIFGGPDNNFENNSDPVVMYLAHIGSDVTRLRIHAEDNHMQADDGISFLGGSCASSCFDLAYSSLMFDFVTSSGQAYKLGGGAWAALSDRRIKEDVQPYLRGLPELRMLRPVRYRYKKEYWGVSERYFTGLIAQEVQEVAPEMVHPYRLQVPGDSLVEVLALNPSDLTYMLINAVKELDAENQQLKAQIEALEAQLGVLEKRISLMEAHLQAPIGKERVEAKEE